MFVILNVAAAVSMQFRGQENKVPTSPVYIIGNELMQCRVLPHLIVKETALI
jgi:hypothetical protein